MFVISWSVKITAQWKKSLNTFLSLITDKRDKKKRHKCNHANDLSAGEIGEQTQYKNINIDKIVLLFFSQLDLDATVMDNGFATGFVRKSNQPRSVRLCNLPQW